MDNVALILPKRRRPEWVPGVEGLEVEEAEMATVPLLGHIAAGHPLDVVEQSESVRVPANMVRKNAYALRVRGHSMVDDGIQDGDIIIVDKRETAENGQSVVAMINGERVTLKRFYIEADGLRLQPANPEMAPIHLRNEEVEILGIVTGVIRQPEGV
ncbi:MAG: transcriptional repressor LexA [Pseudomonadota bacterium]